MLDYFNKQFSSNTEFWKRFGTRPDWAGKRVLEVGCGHGAMSVQIAQAGGTVLGIDLDEVRIDFANRNVRDRYPELADRVHFRAVDALTLPLDAPFDIILSKDTFEHVDDLPALLAGLRNLLVPGGTLYAGFSPLYYSPYGDHRRTGLKLPWAHAVLPPKVIAAAATRHNGRRVTSLNDLGLNGNTPQQYRDAFGQSGMRLVSLGCNRGDKKLLAVLDRIGGRFPSLERFTTVSMYAELQRPE